MGSGHWVWEGEMDGRSPLGCVLVFWGCCNEVPQIGKLKQQKRIVLESWRSEVHEQGLSEVGLFLRALRESVLGLSPGFCWFASNLWCSWACKSITSSLLLYSYSDLPVCLSLSRFPLFTSTAVMLD